MATYHVFLQFFLPVLCIILCPSHWQLFPRTIVEIMDSREKEMNLEAMVIINPRKDIGRAGDLTSDLLLSGPVQYQLSYNGFGTQAFVL